MLKLYYGPGPNPEKVTLLLEEIGAPYELIRVDTFRGQQHKPEFLAINPNGKVPALVDGETKVFDSTAILLHLAEKHQQFLGPVASRGELLSWLFFTASGLGPFCGQAVHFQKIASERIPYAINRYRREAERHFAVLDNRLCGEQWIVGGEYTIADMSARAWGSRCNLVLGDGALDLYPNMKRWVAAMESRPAAARARAASAQLQFNTTFDEEALRHLFPQNYAQPAA